MNLNLLLDLFLSGLVLGISWCLLSCGPVLLTFFGDAGSLKTGFRRAAVFYAGKAVPYVVLGGLIGYSTRFIQSFRNNPVIALAGAGFFLLLAAGNFFLPAAKKKRWLNFPLAGTGLIVGLVPCGPLMSVLVYIGYSAKGLTEGLLGGLMFGLGNFISPLLLTSFFFPQFGKALSVLLKREIYLKVLYSLVYLWWAASLILRTVH